MKKYELFATLIVCAGVIGLIFADAYRPMIATNAEIKRQRAAEEAERAAMERETAYQAELEERERQAAANEAARATACRLVTLGLSLGAVAVLIGGGFGLGFTWSKRGLDLPATKRIDDGLHLTATTVIDRYTGAQVAIGQSSTASIEYAEAFAIAQGGRQQWVKLGYLALQALPMAVEILRQHQIEPPAEAVRVINALPNYQEMDNVR